MKDSEVVDILQQLKAAYPRQPISKDTLEIYARELEPFGADEMYTAMRWLLRNSRFFPTIAELIGSVAERRLNLPGPEDAWGEVASELRRVGHTARPEFSTDLIKEAVDNIGGWRRLCESSNGVSDRARFIDAYKATRRRCVEAVCVIGLRPGSEPLQLESSSASEARDIQRTQGDWSK